MTAVVRTPTEDDRSQVIGVLRDPATGALERLFAGSDPWGPLFF